MQSDLAESIQENYSDQSANIMRMLKQFIASMGSKDQDGNLLVISSLVKGALLFVISTPGIFPQKQLEDKVTAACFRLITKN